MSDEDRSHEPAHDGTPSMDETQPLTGSTGPSPSPDPAPSAPGSPYGAPPGPSAVPPPTNPYGPPSPQAPYAGQDPYAPYAAPTNPYGTQDPQSYGQSHGQSHGQSYGQSYPAPPTNPYPQPGSFDQYGAQPYGAQPYGTYPMSYGAGLPDHPSSTTAMVLGIVALVGIAVCGGITLVLAPFAWAMGSRAVREIDSQPGRYGGRDKANAGRIMGIIGSVLLILGVLIVLVFVVGLFAAGTSSGVTIGSGG